MRSLKRRSRICTTENIFLDESSQIVELSRPFGDPTQYTTKSPRSCAFGCLLGFILCCTFQILLHHVALNGIPLVLMLVASNAEADLSPPAALYSTWKADMEEHDHTTDAPLEILRVLAAGSGRAYVLDSFADSYLKALLHHLGTRSNNAGDLEGLSSLVLDKLKECLETFDKFNEHARKMDVEYFKELLCHSHCFQVCGVMNDGRRVLFFRSGRLERGVWTVNRDSPKWHSRIVAAAWMHLVTIAQNISPCHTTCSPIPIVFDERERDFNTGLMTCSLSLQKGLTPFPSEVYFFGLGTAVTTILRFVESAFQGDAKGSFSFFGPREMGRVHEIVATPAPGDNYATPVWFLDQTNGLAAPEGASYDLSNRRNYYCVERLLNGEGVTAAMVYNPDPAYDWDTPSDMPQLLLEHSPVKGEEERHSALRTVVEGPKLETFVEDSKDDDQYDTW